MTITPLTQTNAERIATWHYPSIYSFYNTDADLEDYQEILSAKKRGHRFYQVTDSANQLVGYYAVEFGGQPNTLEIGLGMAPERVGQGNGLAFMNTLVADVISRYHPRRLLLDVVTFNQRAITVYQRAGFALIQYHDQVADDGQSIPFVWLERKITTEIPTLARRFRPADAQPVARLIATTPRTTNRFDYSPDYLAKLITQMTPEFLKERARQTHFYVFCQGTTIVGCGAIGPYWAIPHEYSLFTIFVAPDHQGQGIGRLIIQTLEADAYFKQASRVEIPASVTALGFYRKMGYHPKNHQTIPDQEQLFRLEKFPRN